MPRVKPWKPQPGVPYCRKVDRNPKRYEVGKRYWYIIQIYDVQPYMTVHDTAEAAARYGNFGWPQFIGKGSFVVK